MYDGMPRRPPRRRSPVSPLRFLVFALPSIRLRHRLSVISILDSRLSLECLSSYIFKLIHSFCCVVATYSLQFRSRIAFKLVWVPPKFTHFVLVDDAGQLMATGNPTGRLPHLQQRQRNYMAVGNGKYSVAANALSKKLAEEEAQHSASDAKSEL